MGFFSALGDAFATGINFCKEAVRVVAHMGPKVLGVAKPFVEVLARVAPKVGIPLLAAFKLASAVVAVAGIAVGIMDKDEKIDDIGERAMEGAEQGIKMDDFEDPEEYLDTIRQIPLNSDRNKYTDEQRMMTGISVIAAALEAKFSVSPQLYALFVQYKDFFTDERIASYMKSIKDTGISANCIIDYFSSNSTIEEIDAAFNSIVKLEKNRIPNLDIDKFENELIDAKMSSKCVI